MARIKNMFDLERTVTAREQSAREALDRFARALAANPCAALRHDSHSAILAAAQLEICLALKQVADGGALATVHEYIVTRLGSVARSLTSRSTNPVANVHEDAQASFLANLLDNMGAINWAVPS